MADSTSFDLQVLQAANAAARAPKPPSPRSRTLGLFIWIGVLALGAGAIAPMVSLVGDQARTLALLSADEADVSAALATEWSAGAPPDYLELLSERSLNLSKPDLGSAEAAARKAVEADPSRGHVWARLAWLESQKAEGRVNAAALDALTRSMDVCPLCSQELIAWRFNFVLANWNSVPDPIRRRAFEQADLLRWIGPNAEFLAEMRVKAKQHGIPFDEYRAAVDTPVRTWDIMAGNGRSRG